MSDFIRRHKLFVRAGYLWAIAMVTQVIMFYTSQPLGSAGTADGVIITGMVGLFGLGLKTLGQNP